MKENNSNNVSNEAFSQIKRKQYELIKAKLKYLAKYGIPDSKNDYGTAILTMEEWEIIKNYILQFKQSGMCMQNYDADGELIEHVSDTSHIIKIGNRFFHITEPTSSSEYHMEEEYTQYDDFNFGPSNYHDYGFSGYHGIDIYSLFSEYLKEFPEIKHTGYTLEKFIRETKDQFKRPRVILADGMSLSIQANSGMYCAPRKTGLDEYAAYEIGFPSEELTELLPYAEEPENPTDTVYAYVPAELINDIIDEHGGIDKEKTLEKLLRQKSILSGFLQARDEQELKTAKAAKLANDYIMQVERMLSKAQRETIE